MPSDDKNYILNCLNKYSSSDITEYIHELRKSIKNKPHWKIDMDSIGVQIRLESLLTDYNKVQKLISFVKCSH